MKSRLDIPDDACDVIIFTTFRGHHHTEHHIHDIQIALHWPKTSCHSSALSIERVGVRVRTRCLLRGAVRTKSVVCVRMATSALPKPSPGRVGFGLANFGHRAVTRHRSVCEICAARPGLGKDRTPVYDDSRSSDRLARPSPSHPLVALVKLITLDPKPNNHTPSLSAS